MAKIRLFVLGTGGMARAHVGAFKADPRVEVVGCGDVDLGRAEAFAKEHGIAKAFGSLDDALAWGEFDAVTNVTPDSVHYPTTMKLIAAKKLILCEKPLAEDFAKADEMAREADKVGLINMVNLTYRGVAPLQQAKRMIAAGDIGEIRHVEASYRQSWLVGDHWGKWNELPMWLWRLSEKHGSKGVLGDVGIHIIDFTTFAIGMMPVNLQARLKTFHKAPGDKIGEYNLDANDSATLSVEFANGALGLIHASRFCTGYANSLKLHVHGTKGAVEVYTGDEGHTLRACLGEDIHTQKWQDVACPAEPMNYAKFIDAIVAGKNGDPDFRRAADLQKIIDLCYSAQAATKI